MLKILIQNNLYIFFLAPFMITLSACASINEEEDSTNSNLEKPKLNQQVHSNLHIHQSNDDDLSLTPEEYNPLLESSSTQETPVEPVARTHAENQKFSKSEDVNLEKDLHYDIILSSSVVPTLEALSSTSANEKIKHNILAYIEKYLIAEEEIPQNKIVKIVRKTTKILFPTLLGCTAGLTLLKPACEAALGNSFLCIMFSGGTFIGLGGAAAWTGLRLISQFDALSEEEAEILRHLT